MSAVTALRGSTAGPPGRWLTMSAARAVDAPTAATAGMRAA
jgi:hypothetical protein